MKKQPKVKVKVIKEKTGQDKVKFVLDEFKAGRLKTSAGKTVTDRNQALAIALSQAGLSNKSLEKAEIANKIRVYKSMVLQKIQKELVKEENHNDKIIDFLQSNPNPPDSAIHAFAEKSGLVPSEIETKIYAILSSFLSAGKSGGKRIDKSEQLKKGIAIESEHTTNPRIAEKIATDHIKENPKYYDWLEWMESLAGKYESPDQVKITEPVK